MSRQRAERGTHQRARRRQGPCFRCDPRRSQAAGYSRRHPAEIEPHQNDLLEQAALSSTPLHRAGVGHLKINRAIATRYDQLVDSFLGMLYLATARYWIKFVHAISSLLVGEKTGNVAIPTRPSQHRSRLWSSQIRGNKTMNSWQRVAIHFDACG